MNSSKTEIRKINQLLQQLMYLSDQLEFLFVEDPLLAKYLLLMKDNDNLEESWIIEPQMYKEIKPFSGKTSWFYSFKFRGKDTAVTGSGADPWLIYRPGLTEALEKLVDKMEKKTTKKSKDKSIVKMEKKVSNCPDDKILNPATGRLVLKTGKIGKSLIG